MIVWYQNLYLDDLIQKRWKRIRKKLEKGKFVPGVKLVCIAANPENLFDILDTSELMFPYYQKRQQFVLGAAYSMYAAQLLVADMVGEVYGATQGFDVRKYFMEGGTGH